MKTVIWSIIIIAVFLFLAKTSVQFKPFKLTFESLSYAIGWIFIAIGFGLLQYQAYSDGEKKGFDNCIKELKEIVKESKEGQK